MRVPELAPKSWPGKATVSVEANTYIVSCAIKYLLELVLNIKQKLVKIKGLVASINSVLA